MPSVRGLQNLCFPFLLRMQNIIAADQLILGRGGVDIQELPNQAPRTMGYINNDAALQYTELFLPLQVQVPP